MKKGLKILLVTIGIIFGILVLASLLAGPIAKRYLEKHSVELCNRQATIGQVWVNVFTGTVLVKDLQVPEQNSKSSFASFEKLRVNVSLLKLLDKKVYIQRVLLKNFDATVIQNGNRFNFSDIIDLYKNKPKKEKKPSKWTVELHNISIMNSSSVYEDAKIGSHIGVKNMNVDVPCLYVGADNTEIKASMDFDNSGNMSTQMVYSIKNGDFRIVSDIHDFTIRNVKPYIAKVLNTSAVDGKLSSSLSINGSMKDILNMAITGKVSLKNAKLSNADNSPLASFSNFAADIDKINLKNKIFKFKKLELNGFDVRYESFADGNSFSKLLKKSSKKEDVEKEKSSDSDDTLSIKKQAPIQYLVKSFAVRDGKISYVDHALTPRPKSYQISDIQFDAKDLKSGSKSPITMTATLGNGGKLNFNANVDVMNLKDAVANLTIQNLDITEFTPYALHYLAYPVEDGLLTFQSDVQIRDNWLDSQNSLDIYKPVFGKRDKNIQPAAAKLPMRAALYAVTDRKGHVNLELPVKGNIKSPDFSFRKIIWKTFANLIVKIAASPIDFIANSVGNSTFHPMNIEISASQLPVEGVHQLNEIAEVLHEKKDAKLTVDICCSDADSEQCDANRRKFYNMIVQQLAAKGVPSTRIVLVNESGKKASAGHVKVMFNLDLSE